MQITLSFEGYWSEAYKSGVPAQSGVYCVYSCIHNKEQKTGIIKKLLYIGESENARERIANHDRLDDWLKIVPIGQTLCYSFAPVNSIDRERAEAALIFKTQPSYNTEHKKEFIYNDTKIITNGKNTFLPTVFLLSEGKIIINNC